MRLPITTTETPRTYRVCVASHLAPGELALPGVSAWTTAYDADGLPITSFRLEVTGQGQLLGLLAALSEPGLTLLGVEWMRESGAVQD